MNFSHIFLFYVFHLCVMSPTMVVRGNPSQSSNGLNIFDLFLHKEIRETMFENKAYIS